MLQVEAIRGTDAVSQGCSSHCLSIKCLGDSSVEANLYCLFNVKSSLVGRDFGVNCVTFKISIALNARYSNFSIL